MFTLMIQGTTSDAGKSTLVAGLCRVLARRGVRVAPFKPQNMALNSAVTVDAGEIGRAQAVQAQACFLPPHSDFNPVLLKPCSDVGAQIIIHGKPIGNMDALDYHQYKKTAFNAVSTSYQRLTRQYEAIIVEGAGSPAEINLRENDIANMGFAESVDCPVILIADIDRGGVFAHIVGTLALLSESERARIIGFVINKFRGDITLLQSGLDWLERHTGKPVLGVLPYLQGIHVEAEDALPMNRCSLTNQAQFRIIIPALPRISNHTDFDALRLNSEIDLRYIGPGEKIPDADLIILPGSKSVRADLNWLRVQGWETAIQRHLRYGGKLIGICGGFQMLGRKIHDRNGVEGDPGQSVGLGFLDMETALLSEKILRNVQGRLSFADVTMTGYEIHLGVSYGAALQRPVVIFDNGCDGAISQDGQIIGTYVHGIFNDQGARSAFLQWAGAVHTDTIDYHQLREKSLDAIADAIQLNLSISRFLPVNRNIATSEMVI